jgi:hypothetical protein
MLGGIPTGPMLPQFYRGEMTRLLLSLVVLAGCRGHATPLSVGRLAKEYKESVAVTRLKYDGKEIRVRGLAISAPSPPANIAGEGSVLLQEESEKLACWFSSDQVQEFSKVRGGQTLTITGVFSGEAGVELKFCRLIEAE